MLSAASAQADALTDAQAKRAQAYNDYFHALQTNHVKKAEDADRLSQQIITPASDAVAKQVQDSRKTAILETYGSSKTTAQSDTPSATRVPTSTPGFSTDTPIEAVDGSNVPKELTFKPTTPTAKPKLFQATPPTK